MIDCLLIVAKEDDALLLKDFITKIPTMNQIGISDNLMDAYSVLLKQRPSLIFLDLDLTDHIGGCEFIHSLPFAPSVVFISSKTEHAIEAFDIGAIDFLQKPLSPARLFKTVNRIMAHYEVRPAIPVVQPEKNGTDHYLFLKADNRIVRIDPDEILYISSQSDYVRIHFINRRPLMLLESMKNMESRLCASRFIRVHRSYIVALDKINCIQKKRIQIGEELIPISDSYYPGFLQRIEQCQPAAI